MEQYELPDGWVWTTIEEIYEIIGGGTPSTKVDEYWTGEIPWISSADIYGLTTIIPRRRITLEAIANSATNLVPDGSLIVVTRVGLGKVALAQMPLCFSQDAHALVDRTSLLSPKYALYYLSQAVQAFKYVNRGTTIAGVTKKQLAQLELPLPPAAEQFRIAEKIEALFEQSRTAREALDAIPALLRQFRQSVLAAAFRGELSTRDPNDEPASALLERILEERRRRWEDDLRARGKDPRRYTYPEPVPPDASALPELPEGWCWATLDQACFVNPRVDRPEGFDEQTPISFVPMAAVDDFTGRIFASEARPLGEVWKGYTRFADGDVIFARITPCMENGKAAIATNLVNGIGTGSTEFHVLRPTGAVLAEWVYHFVRRQSFRDEASRAMTGTAGQLRVPKFFMQQAAIPIPPLNEQLRITSRIQIALAQADAVELAVAFARRRLDRLDQSILARAFRGELVPQDPDDEPASVLLARIRAERSQRAAKRSSRRKDKGRK